MIIVSIFIVAGKSLGATFLLGLENKLYSMIMGK